ncbi:MAG TPA: penicillin-binding transpeptidase domain-containing protein [Terriglobales bacterium]|nr:penicillin-binding transpeptidase domain-containing protein [Terriglobales bacterium]
MRSFVTAALIFFLCVTGFAGTTPSKKTSKGSSPSVTESAKTKSQMSKLKASRPRAVTYSKKSKRPAKRRYYERFYTSSFADDQTIGDETYGEDPVVRAAALEALGNMNGTVVAVDPDTGRILAMVNQKLALSEGAQPCSTIKVAVGLAALSEGVISRETDIKIGRTRMNLSKALAVSNNAFFETVGRRLGFEKVSYYAQQFGLGELAGYNIEGEHLGTFPTEELEGKLGGVGKMCSFGENISMTPLQLAAMTSAMANGGNLYYLQHPRSPEDVSAFQPKLKRTLDIAAYIPDMADGMGGAVRYGTARSVNYNFSEEPILGKTGTCSKDGTRFGWFTSYANTQYGRIVTVVFLRGGRPTYGPKAAEISGKFYRNLYDHSFFAVKGIERSPTALGTSQ